MDNIDVFGDMASGDKVPEAPLIPEPIKKENSMDDFEHLEKREGDSPVQHARAVTQNFLEMERDEFVDTPRAPSADKLSDHLADKFTDSESDAGDSPMHRPVPPVRVQSAGLSEPLVANLLDDVQEAPLPVSAPLVPEAAPVPPPKVPEKVEPVITEEPKPAPPKEVQRPAPEPPKEEPRAPTAHVIEAEVIFCQMGLDAWFDPQRLHPKVESLIYWRDPARSGAALGAGLALLVALACCSVVSVLAYVSLLTLSAAVAFRIYKNVLQAVQKTNEGHPFKWLLEVEVSVPAERAQSVAAAATAHLNATLVELRRLFLVEDLVDSLKFGVLLWCLTYVGALFNGMTLIILGWIALFTLPKAYEMNKAQVDANLEIARAKINEITAKVRAAVPIGRKTESEKDK